MLELKITDEAEKQLKTIPVLADIKRNANIGDLLTFNKSNRLIFGIFNGFREHEGDVSIELRNDSGTKYIRPEEIMTLHAGNGFYNDYRPRGNQGRPEGRNSI